MSPKIDLHCDSAVKQFAHAISVKLSILDKISAVIGITPVKLTSLNEWTSALLLLIKSDCFEAQAYQDPASKGRYDHNKDLALAWITSTGTILAQHDKLVQGNASVSGDEKAAAKKALENDIDKTTSTKPKVKSTTPVSKEPKTALVNYSSIALPDLLSLSTILDAGLEQDEPQAANAMGARQ